MAKQKKGMFSWLGFGKKSTKDEHIDISPEKSSDTAEAENDNTKSVPHKAKELANEALCHDLADSSLPLAYSNEEEETDASEALQLVTSVVSADVALPDCNNKNDKERDETVETDAITVNDDEPLLSLAIEQNVALINHDPLPSINKQEHDNNDLLAINAKDDTNQVEPDNKGFFNRLKQGLLKTRQNLGSGFFTLFRDKKIDDDLFEELEEQLLIADVGVQTTNKLIKTLTQAATKKELKDIDALYAKLKSEMAGILNKVEQSLNINQHKPFIILMVGVNGVGKTTTIGKLARQFQQQGKSVMLAAGDTFRAAAVEQLETWGERNNIPVIAQHTGADSASVIFDAIQAAKSRGIDVLIADTAGRLQNKAHLMEELKKIVRVMKKLDVDAPHEVMLTIDASTGQNAVNQTKLFNEAIGLTGITLTKLDGTAKGGVIFAIADQFTIPIRYIGVGEALDDLRVFCVQDFIEALFTRDE